MKGKKTNKYNFYKADNEKINTELSSIDWRNLLHTQNINEATNSFYEKLNNIISNNTPIIKPKSESYPKWFSNKLIGMLKDNEFYRKKMKMQNGVSFAILYKTKRKESKREKRICLRSYTTNIEPLIKTNPKSFFAYTKAQKQSNNLPSAMFYGNSLAENMRETADLFAEYFSSVYVNHAGSSK